MKQIKLSVIIPAYNEAENFKRGVLEEVNKFLKKQKYLWEVVLVNDGSTDATFKLLKTFSTKNPGFRVLDIPHGGKVAAVSAGIKDAKGEIVLFTDFDQSTPISEVEKVLREFKRGVDVVVGERPSKDVNRSFFQMIRSKAFNLAVQAVALPGIKDTQCGFKAFKNEIGKKLFNELKVTHRTQKGGYMGAFDVEILFLARKYGYKIISIPVSWKYFKSGRLSSLEPLKMLRDVFSVWLFGLSGQYQIPQSGAEQTGGFRYHFVAIVILLILTIPAVVGVIKPGYFRMHDDLQAMRQLVMDKCFNDLQIPCRWSEDLGYGYGYPLFNFYPPLPYYFGQVIHWSGFSFTNTFKVLVVLNFIVTGLAMYLLAQEFWGRWGGLISALFYVYAPYHAVDVYVRAAINEAWALAWFPIIFWSLYKLITTKKWFYVPILALSSAFLMLSHNPMLMIFVPFAIIWAIYWLVVTREFRVVLKLVVGGIWALGLAAFFTLPVIFEQKYAHLETLVSGYFNYLAHFATVNELFISINWGYGDSRFGPIDDMSFAVGHLHWILSLLTLSVALLLIRKKLRISLMIILVFFTTLFFTFLAHEKSSFIWSAIKSLEFLQFPWRFLTLSVFGTSFLAGSIVLFDQKFFIKTRPFFIILAIAGVIYLNKNYFYFKDYWPWVTDQVKFSGELWRLQITSGIFDYLPIWAPLPPAKPPNGDAEVPEGIGEARLLFKNSIRQEYTVRMQESGVLRLNTFYFPGWKYFVDGVEVNVDPYEDKELGRPRIKLAPGNYKVSAKFTNTPVRVIGDTFSLISWLALIVLVGYKPLRRLKNV